MSREGKPEITTSYADDAFARECAKLDPAEETSLAEEGMAAELESWPEY